MCPFPKYIQLYIHGRRSLARIYNREWVKIKQLISYKTARNNRYNLYRESGNNKYCTI